MHETLYERTLRGYPARTAIVKDIRSRGALLWTVVGANDPCLVRRFRTFSEAIEFATTHSEALNA